MIFRRLLITATLAVLAVPAGAQDYKVGALEITRPWTRATPATAQAGGGFLTVTNKGTTPDRLIAARSGATTLELSEMPAPETEPILCTAMRLPIDAGDWRLRHKTSDRWFYEAGLEAAREACAHEALFVRDDGLVTEGCYNSVFVDRDGRLLTPPAALGLLPGVLRQSLIEQGRASEAELTLDDLASGFFVGNAMRGLRKAELLK